jgi:hypothetical protein
MPLNECICSKHSVCSCSTVVSHLPEMCGTSDGVLEHRKSGLHGQGGYSGFDSRHLRLRGAVQLAVFVEVALGVVGEGLSGRVYDFLKQANERQLCCPWGRRPLLNSDFRMQTAKLVSVSEASI